MIRDFKASDIKHYPHFDSHLSLEQINRLVNDPEAVSKNKFYPFFLYEESWQPFRKLDSSGNKPSPKSRPIRYAARKDAYILTHYRRILSELYEAELKLRKIDHCPIAYRKLLKPSGGGKCNIDFAKDAFDTIDALGDCVAIALDIKGYFENLDHQRIKDLWASLLEVDRLPPDHFTVFKNVTNYHVVDQKEVYRRLGIIESITVNGYPRETYTVPYRDMPTQLCTPAEFREKICGGDGRESLIISNETGRGVPQGAPISDLIANFYLMDFDKTLNEYAQSKGGVYMRYSDDILLIIPGGVNEANQAEKLAIAEIQNYGSDLVIKPEKTCIVGFQKTDARLEFSHIRGLQGVNGFEYLGFRYDGRFVYVRDSTISRLYRKVSMTAKGIASGFAAAHPEMSAYDILNSYNYSNFSQRFSRVDDEKLSSDDYSTWTFYSYLKRASETFGQKGIKIMPQARNFKKFMRHRLSMAMVRAVANRDNRNKQTSP